MPLAFHKPLPGKQAQAPMVPRYRAAGFMAETTPQDARLASVLVLLTPTNNGNSLSEVLDWTVLLIRRNRYPGAHSGQIALPGGKHEPEDQDLWATARREAFEEVGLEEQFLKKIGPLSTLHVQVSNFLIHPFVALHRPGSSLRANHLEVEDHQSIPLHVFNPSMATQLSFTYGKGDKRTAPAWQYEGYTIWGATAMVLAELYYSVGEGVLRRSQKELWL